MDFSQVKAGMETSIQKVITEEDAALNFGSGALTTLLATPTLSALMIEASVNCIDPNLPDGHISIGKALNITHDNPSIVGMTVTVKAHIDSVENNKVSLTLTAFDELGLVGTGKHVRFMVNKEMLMKNVNKRCKPIENPDY